jgi:hypothetical protein
MMLSQQEQPASMAAGAPEAHPANQVKALFYVVGDTDPSLLARVVAPVAKLGYAPTRLHASSEAGDGSLMTIDLRVHDVFQIAAERMERALRATVGVHQVIAVYESC